MHTCTTTKTTHLATLINRSLGVPFAAGQGCLAWHHLTDGSSWYSKEGLRWYMSISCSNTARRYHSPPTLTSGPVHTPGGRQVWRNLTLVAQSTPSQLDSHLAHGTASRREAFTKGPFPASCPALFVLSSLTSCSMNLRKPSEPVWWSRMVTP